MEEKEKINNNNENEVVAMEPAAKISDVGKAIVGAEEDDTRTHKQEILDCKQATAEVRQELADTAEAVEKKLEKLGATINVPTKAEKKLTSFSKTVQTQQHIKTEQKDVTSRDTMNDHERELGE